jgi:hypothetical protein
MYYILAKIRLAWFVQQLATGWMVLESNPGVVELFRICADQPWDSPTLLYNVHRFTFPGLKPPRSGFNHSPSGDVKVRVELYLYYRSGPS